MAVVSKKSIGPALAGVAMTLAMGLTAAPVAAQGKDLSDNSVKWLMGGAWAITPPSFTDEGKTITIDKTKRAEVMVPVDVGRDVIKAAWRSALAQICQLDDDVAANHQTMIRREVAKKKWTDQQLFYINQLHLFTVAIRTGKAQIVSGEGDNQVVLNEKPPKVETCSDTERKQVHDQILAYVASESPVAPTTAAAPPVAATAQATPVAAPAAKK